MNPPPLGCPDVYLSTAQLAIIRRHWKDYVWAVGRVGLPARWAFALAGMHYCESGLKEDAKGEAGGPFCLDRGTLEESERFVAATLLRYSHAAKDPTLEADFPTAALVAAEELRQAAQGRIGSTDVDLGNALARYNGFPPEYCEKWQTGAGSEERSYLWHPYVSNHPPELVLKHVGGSTMGDDGKRYETPVQVCREPGGLVIARELEARFVEWFVRGSERPAHPVFG